MTLSHNIIATNIVEYKFHNIKTKNNKVVGIVHIFLSEPT